MTYLEVRKAAGKAGFCHSCPVCNGVACGNTMPGPGSKGTGKTAIRNYTAWQDIYVNMDTISEECEPDTALTLFGERFSLPVLAAPLGVVAEHYGDSIDQFTYDCALVKGCNDSGIAAFTADGLHEQYFAGGCEAIRKFGRGIPTIKPRAEEIVLHKIDIARETGVMALCMDVDAAGLPFLKHTNPPSGRKTVEQLRRIIEYAQLPFILKGIMTPEGARKAIDAGAAAIVVSNHGGRVLDSTPATAWVLPKIVETVNGAVPVLVDGGIRTGLDVFKALALGADAALIGRPFATCIYGARAEGVATYIRQIGEELRDTMGMCSCASLAQITPDKIWRE